MEIKNTIQWKTGSGHNIKVVICESLDIANPYLYINGKYTSGSFLELLSVPKNVGSKKCIAKLGPVGLDQSIYGEIKACIDAMNAEISKKPEVILNNLIEERNDLSLNVNFWINESVSQEEKLVSDGSKNGYLSGKESNKSEINKAKSNLNEFDKTYPQVLGRINKISDEKQERFIAVS